MRIVVSSDWHADWNTLGVRRHGEIEAAVEEVVGVCINTEVDAFVCLGDLSDPDTGGDTFHAMALAIRVALRLHEEEIPSIWIAGNHDVCEDGSGASTLTPLEALSVYFPNIHVLTRPGRVRLAHGAPGEEIFFIGLPFVPVSHGVDMGQAVKELWPANTKVVVGAHLTIPGIHPGSETTDMPRGREVLFPFEETKGAVLRLQGHYHQRQQYDPGDGGPPIVIPGALARLTFGEEDHEPGFLVINV